MHHQKICPGGPTFSRIIAGAWRWNTVSPAEVERLINSAIDLGITTFDHADIYGDYGNEEIFGNALKRDSSLPAKMQIITKCGIKLLSAKRPDHRIKHYDTSRGHIILSAENSLTKLGIGHIDLLLIHRPDTLMNIDEVAAAFTALRSQGKVSHFGVSNFSSQQFDLLQSALSFPLVTNQIELSLFRNAPMFDGTLDHLYKLKTSAMAWSPLGGGKPFSGSSEDNVLNSIKELGEKYKASESQLLLAWLLFHPSTIFPVVGTTKPDRLSEAAGALEMKLDIQDWYQMLKSVTGKDVA